MKGSRTRLSVLRANLRSSGKRLWAAGAAIAISAAFIVGGFMLVDSMTSVVTEEAEAEAAGADLIIRSVSLHYGEEAENHDDGPVTEVDHVDQHGDVPLAGAVEQLESVESAQAIRSGWLEIPDQQSPGAGEYTGTVIPVATLAKGRDDELEAGRFPQGDHELLINSAAAETEQLAVGDVLTAAYVDWDEEDSQAISDGTEYTVVGIAEDSEWTRGFLTAEGMDRLPADPEEGYDSAQPEEIRVVLPDHDHGSAPAQEAVQQEIADLVEELIGAGELPMLAASDQMDPGPRAIGDLGIVSVAGLEISTHQQIVGTWVAERTGDAQMLQWIVFGFGGIAIFVSALVIGNTFQVIVASRQRTMALIRAVGGTATQLRRATLAEGVLLGLLGGAAGVMLGWAVAQGLVMAMNYFGGGGRGLPSVLPNPLAVGLGLGLGLLMAVGSALLPALKAGRVSPMAALRPTDVAAPEGGISRMRVIIGSLVTAAGLGVVVYSATGSPDMDRPDGSYDIFSVDPVTGLPFPVLGISGAIIGFIGVLVLAKAVMPPLVALLGRALAALGIARLPARLAGQNARQVPGRTTATSAALLVGVTLVVTMTVGAATTQKLMNTELSESHPVDGVVFGDVTEELDEDERIAEAIQAPGVTVNVGEDEQGDSESRLVVVNRAEHSPVFHGEWPFPEAVRSPVNYAFAGYELIPYAEDSGGGADDGQLLDVEFPNGAQVQFTLAEGWWSMPGDLIAVEGETLRESPAWFGAEDDDGATLVRLAEGTSATEIQAMVAQLEEAGAEDVSFDGWFARAGSIELIDMLLLAVLALLGASVFVAVIGVSNTLSLSVLERQREAALLRASGMTRRSLGATISIEALLLAAVALTLGSGLGVFFGWAGVSTLVAREDWTVMLEVPWLRLAGVWALTLLAALLAAWFPARRLSRVEPAAGLSHGA
ncbi:ABC transporter permease [Nesterenkonia muleiensis]|uniref:ABC transporter permease n=1 Tax=Nesterenkonia muleiensis TaxID=2282648 RepID=UPI0013004E32|nr:ABC transporter permease [Nesterenkonia muleiensis]